MLHTPIPEFTHAPLFTDTSRKTPMFVRFSTVSGSRGSSDTVRDIRGFAARFYTNEGNFDIVGNNIPVFFVQDAIKFVSILGSGLPSSVPTSLTCDFFRSMWFMLLSLNPTKRFHRLKPRTTMHGTFGLLLQSQCIRCVSPVCLSLHISVNQRFCR